MPGSDDLIADRLAGIARIMRSPLAKDLSGLPTPIGAHAVDELRDLLLDLPKTAGGSIDDAFALATLSAYLARVVIDHMAGDALAVSSAEFLLATLARLQTCMADLSERPAADFACPAR